MNGISIAGRASNRDAAATPYGAAAPVVRLLKPAGLEALEARWRDLTLNAVEQNPFYAPFMLGPALRIYGGPDVEIACVFDAADQRRLIGLAPVAPLRGYARLPFLYLATWMYEHCFFAAPLIRRGCERVALEGLFSLAETRAPRPAFLRLRHLAEDGPVMAAAKRAVDDRIAYATGAYERALLAGPVNAEAYLETAVRKKKRKEMGRLRRRLEEDGGVAFTRYAEGDDLEAWASAFLTLEAAGWKGQEGSALASSAAGEAFFRDVLKGAAADGALHFYKLSVADKPIAMIVNFVQGGEGYSFKIAHDEDYGRYSPGVMLEVEMLKALEAQPALRFVDSCARAGHPMINSLWTGRRGIVGLNVSGAGTGQRLALSAARGLETIKEGVEKRRRTHRGEAAP